MAIPLTAFAAGAVVALLVGVFGRVHDPTLDGTTTLGFDTVIDMKVVVSDVIGVLAVLQVVGALWMYGKLGIAAPSWLGTAHRISGAIALAAVGVRRLPLPVGAGAGERDAARTARRCRRGRSCTASSAAPSSAPIVVKVVAVRSRRAPGWFLPVAGGLLFALLVVVGPDVGGLVRRREGLADLGRVRLRTRRGSRKPLWVTEFSTGFCRWSVAESGSWKARRQSTTVWTPTSARGSWCGREVVDLDGTGTADALVRAQEAVVAAELAQVELVAHWADLHAVGGGGNESGRVLAGTEQEVRLGGDGTPQVREFAATELGVLLGMTTHAARALMRDVLDLRHRHPLLWVAVREGRARFWQARQVTRIVERAGLDREGARHVDDRTAPHLGLVPWGRLMGLVEAAVIEADPETAEQRRLDQAAERFVRTARPEHGHAMLYARLDAGDAIAFTSMCDRVARLLRDQGGRRADGRAALACGRLARHPAARRCPARRRRVADSRDAPTLVVDPATDLDRFLPSSTLYVHLSLEQVLGERAGAARVEGFGPVTIQHAAELMLHRRVVLTPVVDLHETWAVDGYQSSPRIREHVALRYPVEVFPHGTLRSRCADGDHVVP